MEPCAGFRHLCPSPSLQRPCYREALMRGINCYIKSQLYCMGWRRKGQLPGVRTAGLFTVSPEGVGWATIYIYIPEHLTMTERPRAGKLLDLVGRIV